jgi:hypothetical protein
MSVRSKSQHDPFESKTLLRRVVAASMAGTVVEWYEFFLYGTAATLVFSKVFFRAAATSSMPSLPPL